MAGDSGMSFPVAGLAVVALFLSTAFLAPRGFDLLRQAESDAGRQVRLSQPAVEARLWEDPLEALRRHLAKLKDLCANTTPAAPAGTSVASAVPAGTPSAEARCQDGQPETPATFTTKIPHGGLTVIAAMLPGATFVGSEEARRRSRYAVLAGLNVAGYVPDNGERMSLLRLPRCESFSGCPSEGDQAKGQTAAKRVASANNATPPTAGSDAAPPPPPAMMDMVYETFSAGPNGTGEAGTPRRRVVVLWIDDSLFGRHWLSRITILLKDLGLSGEGVTLRILGPADTGGLVDALSVDLPDLRMEASQLGAEKATAAQGPTAAQADDKASKADKVKAFGESWQTLAKLRLISPNSTAPDEQLLTAAHPSDAQPAANDKQAACSRSVQPVEQAFKQQLDDVQKTFNNGAAPGQELAAVRSQFFVRTIGTDDLLIDRLVVELFGRGLDAHAAGASRRVALIGEWDSIYARTFAAALRARLSCESNKRGLKVDLVSYQYLRGLDGVTVEGAPTQNRRSDDNLRSNDNAKASDNSRSSTGNAPPVEWPEGRDQRDYLRRLVDQRLGQSDWRHAETEVQAIGIIGNDVPDKLMMLQALRESFQDRTVFTTDLDARMLHPAVNRYTRNLIVASSLPLALGDDLQCGIAPFRDSYQTAMFLAARYAATGIRNAGADDGGSCRALNATQLEVRIRDAITHPLLFEIGRDGLVELAAASGGAQAPRSAATAAAQTAATTREAETRLTYAVLAGIVFLMLGVMMVLGKPGPAMLAAQHWWASTGAAVPAAAAAAADKEPPACSHRSTIIVAMLQAAALGFAAGVVIELGAPGSVGPSGAVLFAAAAAAFFWAFLYPGTRWVRELRAGNATVVAGVPRGRRWERFMLQVVLFAAAVILLWMVWVAPQTGGDDLREPFAALNGASAWPSQLLRTLAIVLFAWFLDYAWCRTAQQADDIGAKYFLVKSGAPAPAPAADPPPSSLRRAFTACADATIWLWQPKVKVPEADGAVDGSALWREYRRGLLGWPRLGRIALWSLVTIGLILLVSALVGGAQPEIPARGIADRQLFLLTLITGGLLLLFMMVLVADATVLTWRFIILMKSGRTLYPDDTVQTFAAELGPTLQAQAATRIAASAVARGPDGRGRNTLLDDWIDARLLGEHTAVIGPLIFFPFILLALMIVARSHLFDNWQIGNSIMVMFAGFVLWSLAMAALLNYGAESARTKAVQRMQADLLWLKGAGPDYAGLAEQFPGLIDQVRNLRQGAFAPFFQQPLVRALLVPLGGAGGIQLLELVMFGR
jgi:hypothetical protein